LRSSTLRSAGNQGLIRPSAPPIHRPPPAGAP
jgi:hypothetical protein